VDRKHPRLFRRVDTRPVNNDWGRRDSCPIYSAKPTGLGSYEMFPNKRKHIALFLGVTTRLRSETTISTESGANHYTIVTIIL
jgi:hypothetical protein